MILLSWTGRLAPEGGTSSPLNASSSRVPYGPSVEEGCAPPSAVVPRPSRPSRDGSSDHRTEPAQSMTVHGRVALGRGSPGVVSSHSQTGPVQSARERKTREVAPHLTPSLHAPVATHRPLPCVARRASELAVPCGGSSEAASSQRSIPVSGEVAWIP